MSENITPNGNDNNLEKKTDVQEELTSNPTDTQKVSLRYKSIEEAEKAKNETDKELAGFAKFTKALTQEDALIKLDAMYELDSERVNRYYQKTFGKTYEEAKQEREEEVTNSGLKEKNPEIYELKKKLEVLESELNQNKSQSNNSLIDSFVSQNPEVNKEELESELKFISNNLPLEQRLAKAYKILAAEGKINIDKENTYLSYKKKASSLVGLGKTLRQDVLNSRPTEEDKIKSRFDDPKTLPPSFKKII